MRMRADHSTGLRCSVTSQRRIWSWVVSCVLLAWNSSIPVAAKHRETAPAESSGTQTEAGAASLTEVNRPIRDKWALVVGISEFADSAQNLTFPAKDAQDFAAFLVKEAGFAPDHVKVLLNGQATEKRILSELGNRWLPRVANPDDLVVLFISTHGSGAELDVGGQNYLVAYDTDVNDLYTSGIPMNRLAEDIKERVHCDRVVIFLDACHSGATTVGAKGLSRTGVDADEFAVGSGQLVITSSTESQVSWESKSRQNSVFTAALIDALRSKGDKTSLGDMFKVLKDRVQDTVLRERGVLQTPVMKSAWLGQDIILAANPVSRQPGLDTGTPTFNQTSVAVSHAPEKRNSPLVPIGALPVAGKSGQAGTSTEPTSEDRPELMARARGTPRIVPKLPFTEEQNPVEKDDLKSAPSAVPLTRVPLTITPSTSYCAESTHHSESTIASATRVKQSALLVPGVSIGRTSLGTGKDDLVKLLGKPGDVQGNSFVYRTADKKYFLCVHFTNDAVSEIAFTSPVFSTAAGINLANFRTRLSELPQQKQDADRKFDVFTGKGGGFSVLSPRDGATAIGVIHGMSVTPDRFEWVPSASPPTTAAPPVQTGTTEGRRSAGDLTKAKSGGTSSGVESASSSTGTTPANGKPGASSIVVPGSLLGRTRLGSSRAELLKRLGRPSEDLAEVVNYWTGDHRLFVSIRFRGDLITDIAFCSSAFCTEDGIGVKTYKERLADAFRPPFAASGWDLFTLKQGGFTIATKDGKVVGWVHSSGAPPAGVFWPQR